MCTVLQLQTPYVAAHVGLTVVDETALEYINVYVRIDMSFSLHV